MDLAAIATFQAFGSKDGALFFSVTDKLSAPVAPFERLAKAVAFNPGPELVVLFSRIRTITEQASKLDRLRSLMHDIPLATAATGSHGDRSYVG
jgi:hypothetical protein